MAHRKSTWRSIFKNLYISKKKNIQCHKNNNINNNIIIIKSTSDIPEDDTDIDTVETGHNSVHSKSLKRHKTCSIDLSDKTYRLKTTQELSDIEATSPLPRTSSINLHIDFPKKMLQITDFEENEVLGQGAFGRAIKVKYLKTGTFYVMKEVISHSPENEESLIREVSLLRSLKHKNVLTCLGLVLKDKRICLLSELMHGGSLQAKILDLDQPIDVKQKILFLRDIAAGMNFLHQNSIMHRDLTSSNCLLRRNNTVVVSDFGLSKFLRPNGDKYSSSNLLPAEVLRCASTEMLNDFDRDNHLHGSDCSLKLRNFLSVEDVSQTKFQRNTGSDFRIKYDSFEKKAYMNLRRKHTVVGNPFWMAPEMLGGKNYNCLVDLYSYGIIGCEITARISAHPDILERHNKDMSVNFPDFLEKNKEKELINCPEELIYIIEQCCKTDPDDRPTFNTVLSWLDDILFRFSNNLQLKSRWSKAD